MRINKLFLGLFVNLCVLFCVQSAMAGDPFVGAPLYAQHCENCHGTRGESLMPGVPNLLQGNALMKPDKQLLVIIKAGKGIMPAYQGLLKEEEILHIIAHIRTLF